MAMIPSKVWHFHDFYFSKVNFWHSSSLFKHWLFFCLFKFWTSTKIFKFWILKNLSTWSLKKLKPFKKLLRWVCYLMQPIIILDGISLCKVVETFSTKSRRCTRLDQMVDINCNTINVFPFGPRKHNVIFKT